MRNLPFVALLMAPVTASAQDSFRPDDTVRDALSLQITDRGFNAIESLAAQLVPTLLGSDLLVLDPITLGSGSFSVELRGSEPGTGPTPDIQVQSVQVNPVAPTQLGGAQVNIVANLLLGVNSPSNPYNLRIRTLFDWCNSAGWINPTAVTANIQATIVVEGPPGAKTFDVNLRIPSNSVTLGAINAEGACGTVLDVVGTALSDVIIDAVLIPTLRPTLDDLEVQIEDALAAAAFSTSLDVLDSTLFVDLQPLQVVSTNAGLEILYTSKITSPQAECVKDIDPLGSLRTDTPIPGIGSNDALTQIAAYVSDDMINQALYAAFSGGLLCLDVDAELLGDSLPIALDSSLVTLLGGQAYESVIPAEAAPLLIRTRPQTVPQVSYTGDSPITIELRDFGLDFFTEIENRQARIFGLDLDVDAGAGVAFDNTTGSLGLDLNLAAEDFDVRVTGDVFVPGTEADLEESFKGLLDTILGIALGSLLGDFGFDLPNFSGVGLTSLDLGPAGTEQDWLRAKVSLGPVSYGDPNAGCAADGSGDGGCGGGCGGDAASCGGGCASGGLNLGTYLFVLFPIWVFRRRQRA